MNGLFTICSGVQQITLQSHHVTAKAIEIHELVSELLIRQDYILIALDGKISQSNISLTESSRWISGEEICILALCKPTSIGSLPKIYIRAL